jgi:hypothetical protein
MLVEETITYLEMTAPDQLVPGRLPPTAIDMERHDRASLPLLRSTYARIGAPHGWVARPAWSDTQWLEWLSSPGVQPWLARTSGEVAGLIELELQRYAKGLRRPPADLGDPAGVGRRGVHQTVLAPGGRVAVKDRTRMLQCAAASQSAADLS